jgi:hypothetical protein
MVKERRPKPTEMFMKGRGRMTEVTACVRLFLLMEMFTLERWPIPKDMDMENLPMPMELVGMMVNGRMISPKRTTLQAPKRIYLDCLGKKNKNPCLSLSKIASFKNEIIQLYFEAVYSIKTVLKGFKKKQKRYLTQYNVLQICKHLLDSMNVT